MKLFSRFGRVGCISPPSSEYITVKGEEMEKLIPATINFSFSLMKEIGSSSNENIFISPFSITTALAMTAVGANGASKTQMLSTLNMADVTDEELQQFFHSLIKESSLSNSACSLKVANGMFVENNFEILDKYRQILKECFEAREKNVRFSEDETRKDINKWVEEITQNKIKDLLPSGSIDDLTRLVLVNAVYFKGLWSQPFDPIRTFKSPFHLTSNETTEVDMMHVTSEFNYINCPDMHCSCVELPYVGDNLSMVVILPDEVDGLKELEAKMNCDILQKLLSSMYKRSDVQVYLPKFKIESSLTLEKILSKMGMTDIFGENADLSGIAGTKDLRVSSIVHKSFVEVNEEGTEAAAATAVMVRFLCAVIPTEFVVNHPFMVLIRNRKSGNILFMGNIHKL